MIKPIALVDVDDTLFDCIPNVLKLFNNHTGLNLTKVLDRNLDRIYNLTREEVMEVFNANKEYMDNMRVFQYAKEFVDKLSTTHDIHICTARGFIDEPEFARAVTKRQLDDAGIGYTDLHIMDTSCKLTYAKSIGLSVDLIVDDCPKQISNAISMGIDVILSSQEYNTDLSSVRRIKLDSSPDII